LIEGRPGDGPRKRQMDVGEREVEVDDEEDGEDAS
jgi:hypothetical protein